MTMVDLVSIFQLINLAVVFKLLSYKCHWNFAAVFQFGSFTHTLKRLLFKLYLFLS